MKELCLQENVIPYVTKQYQVSLKYFWNFILEILEEAIIFSEVDE
jgi:hypothetical protein